MCYCNLCGYSIVTHNIKKLLIYTIKHFIYSHSKTHKAFTIIFPSTIQKHVTTFIDNFELNDKLSKKIKSRKPPYVTYISEQYHKQHKHVIFQIQKMDPFDYLLLKESSKKHKLPRMLIL